MFVCIYVAIYFRAWYDGCGQENVRIFPGSAPELLDTGWPNEPNFSVIKRTKNLYVCVLLGTLWHRIEKR